LESVDIVVIGAGVVGLSIARLLSQRTADLVVVERHDGFGRETSSRNSQVIHAGFYYPQNSLKAQLCVEGNPKLHTWCREQSIPHRKCGKILVANTPDEEKKIHALFMQGQSNGVDGLRLLSRAEVSMLEPDVVAKMGLYSPATGILDSHQLMKSLESSIEQQGATIAYGCTVTGLMKTPDGFSIQIRDADSEPLQISSAVVINAAGLSCDAIAALAGINPDAAGYRIHPCKGEYFRVSGKHRNRLGHLVYPAPTPISLGVHAVLELDGTLRLGPNAFYGDALDYDVDPAHRHDFYIEARKYLPFIEESDLWPDQAGIRPKLQGEGESFRDFMIKDETDRGLTGLINLIGIESPGLTACLAIAEKVDTLL
jgi:L-2-hydroxyglutarate oxidase LhgO